MRKKISVSAFEEKVAEVEGVVLVVRAAPDEMVDDYDYANKAAANTTIRGWLDVRVKPLLGGFPFVIIDGDHAKPHQGQKMETLRSRYEK
ncbi:MAG: hypothetical protein ABL855_05555 [Sideroxydans sp.]